MFQAIKRYTDFEGRSNRSEYWLFILFCIIFGMACAMIDAYTGNINESGRGALTSIFYLFTFVPSLSVMVRRLHDIDRSGWWWFIIFIPIGGAIVLLAFLLLPGTQGPNRFGEQPE